MTNYGKKSIAQTVNGPIKKKEIGFTLMHEHIFCDLRKPENRNNSKNKYKVSPNINHKSRIQLIIEIQNTRYRNINFY